MTIPQYALFMGAPRCGAVWPSGWCRAAFLCNSYTYPARIAPGASCFSCAISTKTAARLSCAAAVVYGALCPGAFVFVGVHVGHNPRLFDFKGRCLCLVDHVTEVCCQIPDNGGAVLRYVFIQLALFRKH